MDTKTLPLDLLQTLFLPPAAFADLADRIKSQEAGDENLEEFSGEVIDGLEYDVEIKGTENDDPDHLIANVDIKSRSREKALEKIKWLGGNFIEQRKQMKEDLSDALFSRMDEVLLPLDKPEMADLRKQIDVQGEWVDAADQLDCKARLLDYATHKEVSAEWWGWLLEGAYAAKLENGDQEESPLALLSRRYLAMGRSAYPEKYAEAWLSWSLRNVPDSKKKGGWEESRVVHGLWLASTLADPSGRLATELDARGLSFDMGKVDWNTVLLHSLGRKWDEALTCAEVSRFLEKYLTPLTEIDPAYAGRSLDVDHERADRSAWANRSASLLVKPENGLADLLVNVPKREDRDKYVALLASARINHQTSPAPSAARAGARL